MRWGYFFALVFAACAVWFLRMEFRREEPIPLTFDTATSRARQGWTAFWARDPFVQAQREVTGALSRLLAVAENYPQLKSDQNFRELQAQLEGTENRIAVARQRFIKATQEYNTLARQFPTNLTAMAFGYKPKPQFSVEDEKAIAKPPSVDFGTKK